MTKPTKAVIKADQKPAKQYKDIDHSDTTINEVKKLISLKYKNTEIAKMLQIHKDCVSKIRGYLKRHSWTSNDFIQLARSNIKTALQNGDLRLSEKVFDHANKQHAPAEVQHQQSPTLTVNVGTLLDELAYKPTPTIDVIGSQSHEEAPTSDKAAPTMREGEIVDA